MIYTIVGQWIYKIKTNDAIKPSFKKWGREAEIIFKDPKHTMTTAQYILFGYSVCKFPIPNLFT